MPGLVDMTLGGATALRTACRWVLTVALGACTAACGMVNAPETTTATVPVVPGVGVLLASDGVTITALAEFGGCIRTTDLTADEGPATVVLHVVQSVALAESCPPPTPRPRTVRLSAPLGDRRLTTDGDAVLAVFDEHRLHTATVLPAGYPDVADTPLVPIMLVSTGETPSAPVVPSWSRTYAPNAQAIRVGGSSLTINQVVGDTTALPDGQRWTPAGDAQVNGTPATWMRTSSGVGSEADALTWQTPTDTFAVIAQPGSFGEAGPTRADILAAANSMHEPSAAGGSPSPA